MKLGAFQFPFPDIVRHTGKVVDQVVCFVGLFNIGVSSCVVDGGLKA